MIFILTGPQQSGKTTLLMRTASQLNKKNIQTEGFLSIAKPEKHKVEGYDLFDLKEQNSLPIIRRKGVKDWEKVGPFHFIPQGLSHAKRLILASREDSVLIIDEIGPLELRGKGFWPALKQVIFSDRRIFLVAVRNGILEDFLRITREKETEIFDIEKGRRTFWPGE